MATTENPDKKADIPEEPFPMFRVPLRASACSDAGYRFQLQHFQIFDFFMFGVMLSTGADKARFAAAKALAGMGDKEHVSIFEKVQQNPEPMFQKLKSFSGVQS